MSIEAETRLEDIASGADITPQTRLEAIIGNVNTKVEELETKLDERVPDIIYSPVGSELKVSNYITYPDVVVNFSSTLMEGTIMDIPVAYSIISNENCHSLDSEYFNNPADDAAMYITECEIEGFNGRWYKTTVIGIDCFVCNTMDNTVIGKFGDNIMVAFMGTAMIGVDIHFNANRVLISNAESEWCIPNVPTLQVDVSVDNSLYDFEWHDNVDTVKNIMLNNSILAFKYVYNSIIAGILLGYRDDGNNYITYHIYGDLHDYQDNFHCRLNQSAYVQQSTSIPLFTSVISKFDVIPNIGSGNAGKLVGVNSTSDGYELVDAPSGGMEVSGWSRYEAAIWVTTTSWNMNNSYQTGWITKARECYSAGESAIQIVERIGYIGGVIGYLKAAPNPNYDNRIDIHIVYMIVAKYNSDNTSHILRRKITSTINLSTSDSPYFDSTSLTDMTLGIAAQTSDYTMPAGADYFMMYFKDRPTSGGN